MTRLLLTGATGFIGSHLVPHLLDRGHQLGLIVRHHSNQPGLDSRARIFLHNGETSTLSEIVRTFAPDTAVHLATYFVAGHQSSDIDFLIESNLRFGCQFLDALDRHKVDRLINFGTAWQHFETDDYRPVSLYAATKQAFDDLALYYADASSLNVINLKLADIYGPNDSRPKLVPLLRQASRTGESLDLSPGAQRLNLTYIDDVLSAVDAALSHPVVRAVENYAVGSGEIISLRSLVKLFEEIGSCRLTVNWGAKPYRVREVMDPWVGTPIPGWAPRWSLRMGLRAVLNA